jgi:uncharacterized membrane protein
MALRFRKRPRLALELSVALVVKLVALVVIWNLWFADPQDRDVDGEDIARAIYAAPAVAAPGRDDRAARP